MRCPLYARTFVLCVALLAALARSSSGWSDATTGATLVDSKFEIRGVLGQARHTRGGDPAKLDHARFAFANHGDKSRQVSVVDIEFLHGSQDCGNPPNKVASHPRFDGILLEKGMPRASAAHVDVPAGVTVKATVSFSVVTAYASSCDRCAFRVRFQVGREKVSVTDEVTIARMHSLNAHDR